MTTRCALPLLAPAAALTALLLGGQGCSALPWAGESDRGESGAIGLTATLSDEVEFVVPAKGYLEAEKASGVAVPRVPTGSLKVKEVALEGTIVKEGDVVVVFDDTQLNIDLDNHLSTLQSTSRRMDKNRFQGDIEIGSIGVMKEVAAMELENVEAVRIEDEAIFSKLEILEEIVRKDEAAETIIFADASLELRGQYYDIEERILDVEKQKVKGDVGRVETSLGNLVLRAPIGGLVLYKKSWRGTTVAVGDTLQPGNLIMSLVDPASTVLTAFVLEKDAAGVAEGASATVTIDARPGRIFHGKVKSIAEISRPIEQNSPVKFSEVKITVDDAEEGLLKPGMKGEARILTGSVQRALVLPRSAVRGEPESPWVLVRGSDAPEHRAITTGPGDQVRVSILKGLTEGEIVLLGGESVPGGGAAANSAPESETPPSTAAAL
jgi:multidrug efflux pump subunit AcrA (membrane-fusion protein)